VRSRLLVPALSVVLSVVLPAALLTLVPAAASAAGPEAGAEPVRPAAPVVGARNAVEFTLLESPVLVITVYTQTFDERAVFEAQVRRGPVRSEAPDWRMRPGSFAPAPRRDSAVLRLPMAPGTGLCLRARELADVPGGRPSPWSEVECVARAFDDDGPAVRARGGRVVPDRRFVDDRATVLDTGDLLSLRGVPAGARAGVLQESFFGTDTAAPEWRVGRAAFRASGFGGSDRAGDWLARPTRTGGTLQVRSLSPSDRIGGLVVLPRWIR
jgi:hypothetical protein